MLATVLIHLREAKQTKRFGEHINFTVLCLFISYKLKDVSYEELTVPWKYANGRGVMSNRNGQSTLPRLLRAISVKQTWRIE